MNIHENLKMKEHHVKKHKPWGEVALLGPFKIMPNYLVGPSKCETKFTSNYFGMGYVKMHGYHGNPLYDFRECGVGLQIQPYLGFYLSQSTKLGVKLKLKHLSYFL